MNSRVENDPALSHVCPTFCRTAVNTVVHAYWPLSDRCNVDKRDYGNKLRVPLETSTRIVCDVIFAGEFIILKAACYIE